MPFEGVSTFSKVNFIFLLMNACKSEKWSSISKSLFLKGWFRNLRIYNSKTLEPVFVGNSSMSYDSSSDILEALSGIFPISGSQLMLVLCGVQLSAYSIYDKVRGVQLWYILTPPPKKNFFFLHFYVLSDFQPPQKKLRNFFFCISTCFKSKVSEVHALLAQQNLWV